MLNKILLICFVCSLIIPSFGQTPITLEECRQEALAKNKSILKSDLQTQKAEATAREAKTAYLPAIDGSGNAAYIPKLDELKQFGISRDNLLLYQAQISAQQPIYAGGKIRLANEMAKKGISISQNAEEQKSSEIILQTDKAYWNLVAMQEQLYVVKRYIEALDSLEEQLRASYEWGLVPKSELLKVTVQRNQAEVTSIEVKNAVRLLQMNLAQIIGRPIKELLKGTTKPDIPENNELLTQKTDNDTPENRPEIKILEVQTEIANLKTKSVKADYLPQLGAQVGYSYLKAPDIISGSWNLTAMGKLSIPIVHWREKKHKTKKAEISEQMANLELENTRELIDLEISQAFLKLQEGIEKIHLATKSLDEATESLSEVESSYNAGLNTITDLLNAQTSHQRAEASLVEAKSDYQILKSSWLKATGRLNAMSQ